MTIAQQQHLILSRHEVSYHDLTLFKQTDGSPIAFLGCGNAAIEMYRGNFDIKDNLQTKIPLTITNEQVAEDDITLTLGFDGRDYLELNFTIDGHDRLQVTPTSLVDGWDRLWLRLFAQPDEKVYGAGEQLSYFNLRGHHFPLWSSEPGIGRNKHTLTTFQADQDHAGGDYYTTNYPEATFVSTQHYFCHVDSYTYADFDFQNDDYHELQFWGVPTKLIFDQAPTYLDLVTKLTALMGRNANLPHWTDNGIILGLQGGTQRVNDLKNKLQARDVQIAGLWCQDWEGIRMTSFGKRLFWDWRADDQLYPHLTDQIQTWQQEGIQFLGYINPYIANDAESFQDAAAKGYFAQTQDGGVYLVDFGEFHCGVVDFTNPDAFNWFKGIIKHQLIDAGITGWMADFGEYLPTDVVLYDHSDPLMMHNKWPVLWAQCNYEAVQESGKADQLMYFMRAGAAGSQKYAPLLWAGDQSVNWSHDDGLISTVPAALSSGIIGNSLSHSDIGGYTSLYGNVRSKELFMRWAEMAAFTPVMRSHEGNRPDQNFQVYEDDEAIDHLAQYTKVFKQLTAYRRAVIAEAAHRGLPAQRPLFMHYEDDAHAYDVQDEFLFGSDLLVAPVSQPGQTSWSVYLPDDQWIHLWSARPYSGGTHTVPAPLGEIPVFYRKDSAFADLFQQIGASK